MDAGKGVSTLEGRTREQEGAMETSSMATGIFKAETRGKSSWKEDVFVRMEQSPLPPNGDNSK